jgi:hypothetical protein
MIVVDDLLSAMDRQDIMVADIEDVVTLYYTEKNFKEQLKKARIMRNNGECVELLPENRKRENDE